MEFANNFKMSNAGVAKALAPVAANHPARGRTPQCRLRDNKDLMNARPAESAFLGGVLIDFGGQAPSGGVMKTVPSTSI
jgi:hypothetical protein